MDTIDLYPDDELCGLCGNVAAGFASVSGVRYCHGEDDSPTCYERAVRGEID